MSTVFDAYNLQVDRLVEFYQRINAPITYPDGMTTSLGIIYWGKEKHQNEIAKAIPRLQKHGTLTCNDVFSAIRTPIRASRFSEQTGISKEILRILKHDLELWLPRAVSLKEFAIFKANPGYLNCLARIGLADQLEVIAAGQTPSRRQEIPLQTGMDISTIQEIVRLCDYYRTGKNLAHIRAKLYYEMGIDTWQKWAQQTSEGIIARFSEYIRTVHLDDERLIPWPKEVRNGIEWAKMHLEVYTVQW
ncbi:MAG: DUF4332 domain-containing protein [Candidatus Cloacimonetes bacterium]|nr:DUF4332 domain-containing protein [Candidatus Cloacimonadota bacterium]